MPQRDRDRILARRARFIVAAMLSAGCSSTTVPQACLSPKCDDACNGPIDSGADAKVDAPADSPADSPSDAPDGG